MAQTLNKDIIVSQLVEDFTITLFWLDILKDDHGTEDGYVLFNKRLEEYWNDRIRRSPEDFPYIR